MADEPDVAEYEIWRPGTGQDPAKYLVDPGTVRLQEGQVKASPGSLRHGRPCLMNGNHLFVFPVGVEGFTRSGTATLGLHRYIGDNSVDGITVHYEEGRIELRGTFPGLTAQDTMVDCINVLRSPSPDPGLVLFAPGVFEQEQYVLPETWNFDHAEDDRTHSITYSITFVRIGEGGKVSDKHGAPPPPNPGTKTKPKGKPSQIFTIKDGARTLRQVAASVYGNQDLWQRLVDLNAGQLADWQRGNALNDAYNLPTYQLPTFRWPIGTQFRY
jgi:hypothetical protein